jgi:CRISPR-associated protein Cas5d
VGAVASTRNIESTMRAGRGRLGIDVEEERQQRAGLFLRDVAYRLHGRFEMTTKASAEDTPAKFAALFQRRAEQGQCVNQPYLGCREFSADVRLVTRPGDPPDVCEAVDGDFGWMLYDLDFRKPSEPSPQFFRVRAERGVIRIPAWNSAEVRG